MMGGGNVLERIREGLVRALRGDEGEEERGQNPSSTSWKGGWVVDSGGETGEETGRAGAGWREGGEEKSESSDISSTTNHLPDN